MKDRICIITGGALGIGRCLVQEFIKKGAQVGFIDMDQEAGEQLAQETGAKFYHGDIAESSVLESYAEWIRKEFGSVDFLINNACLSRGGILKPCSYEDFNYVLRVGVSAPYYLTQLLLPMFTKEGAVVNITSTRAYMSQADTESYTAAKGGISALTHGMAVSLSGRIRVNSIAPGQDSYRQQALLRRRRYYGCRGYRQHYLAWSYLAFPLRWLARGVQGVALPFG